jgi:multidrug efflux system membrane fusion protein
MTAQEALNIPTAARRRSPHFRWGLVVIALIAAGLMLWLQKGGGKTAKVPAPQVVPVSTAVARSDKIRVSVAALGAAQSWQGVTIRAQVNGKLQSVSVQEGSEVKVGDLIAQIDPAPYQALLTQSQGALERDEAQLAIARIDLKRYQDLVEQDSIARSQMDTQGALVKQLEGTVLIDKGSVDAARVNLNYCRITSPVAGRVGVRLVDAGNLVSTTDTGGIVTINQMVPMAVTFAVPEGDFQRLSEASSAFSQPLNAQAFSQDSGAPLGDGILSVTDNHVDPASGTVQLKAKFPNTSRKLWPGQFVNVHVILNSIADAIVVPNTAVNRGPNGTFVYVVGADNKAVVRPITLAFTQDELSVIKSGLAAGETVITDGQISLKPGTSVSVRNGAPAVPPDKPAKAEVPTAKASGT